MNIVFLGPPGAGKGTIAALAKERLGVPHISTGDLFRAAIHHETPLGLRVKSILASGELVPDEVTIEMVKERLAQSDCSKGFILDGFPRTINQAEALGTICSIDIVINFVLERDQIIRRLSGRRIAKKSGKVYHIYYNPPKRQGICDESGEELIQRDDDREEAVLNRLEVYERQTEPLIAYYRSLGLLVDMDSSKSAEEVLSSLLSILEV